MPPPPHRSGPGRVTGVVGVILFSYGALSGPMAGMAARYGFFWEHLLVFHPLLALADALGCGGYLDVYWRFFGWTVPFPA